MPAKTLRPTETPQTGSAAAFLKHVEETPFEKPGHPEPYETAEAFLKRLGGSANKSSIAEIHDNIVQEYNPKRSGDVLPPARNNIDLLHLYLAKAEMLAREVRPEIVEGIKAIQQAADSANSFSAGLQPHARPRSTTIEEMPTWAKPVANLTDTERVQRRAEQRLRKRKSRALQKEF